MKKDQYQKLKKYSKILEKKELYPLINDIIKEYEHINLEQERNQNRIILMNQNGEKIYLEIVENKLIFTKYFNDTMIQKDIIVPNTDTVLSINIEKRPSGIIVKKVYKKYGFSIFTPTERTVTNLESVTSIYKNTTLQSILPNINHQEEKMNSLFKKLIGTNEQLLLLGNHIDFLGIVPDMTINLEIDRKILISIYKFPTNDEKYLTKQNQEDISAIYSIVDGKDRISRIYDLYNGIINEKNKYDIQAIHIGLLSSDAFDLKTKKGISDQIDQLVGCSITPRPMSYYKYLEKFLKEKFDTKCNNLDNREELLNSINETRTLIKTTKIIQKAKKKEKTKKGKKET